MAVRATQVSTGIDIVIGPITDPVSHAVMDEVYGYCGAGVLECREHDDNPAFAHLRDEDGRVHGAWVYLQKRRDKWVICHLPNKHGLSLASHEVHVGMTDQHRWQQDYYERAAQDAGWQTAQEVPLNTGTRLDLVIAGPAGRFGVEVQHSSLSTPKVRARDRKATQAGITSIWSADRKLPSWAFKVAHVETNELPHGYAPSGSWTVTTGPRRIVPARCAPANFDQCWQRRRRSFCGGWHPLFRPIAGLRVDDVAAQVPAGELVRLDTLTKQGIVLVTARDYELWEHEFADQVALRTVKRPEGAAQRCEYRPSANLLQAAEVRLCRRCGAALESPQFDLHPRCYFHEHLGWGGPP